ncbi:prohead protease/major capsid protein fusion protein [Paenirhodobacter sp. CAU 1674]|uniref:prohead protease/major capsid protein fusion protein n=1 Tax=Paenirhodobacter sp. CAU 1674 TaxID=3032596 RepID=UPI0023DA79F9|nr:prohead protease/major capsid protein fusion protein [Paenirhodobacter sp. CAU 1674]MDF2142063.1 HK97 family phage prohead protease [Paenirhodobacter sp. CAU 1674]
MPLDNALTRAAQTRPNSYDPETRTVSAVIATPSPVTRRDARGPFLEVLTADTLDLSGADGLPVLDSHRTASVRDQLGRVRSVAVEGDAVVAVLEITSAEDAAPVVQRIADGTVSGVSIGYRVSGWTERNTPQGRVKSPTGWRLTEVTLTSNPADPSARLRQKEEPMPETIETLSPQEAEAQRRSDIRGLVRAAGLGPELADQLIDDEADMTAAKAAVFDAQQTRRSAPVVRVHGSNEDPATIRTRQAEALAYRMGGLEELPEASRTYADVSLMDMAREAVERMGTSTRGMSRDEVLHRAAAHGTSDFALTVMDATGKTAMASYRAAESPLKALCRKQTLRDFKTSTAIRLGEMGELEEMAENGEFTATSRAEEGESINLKTFGRRIDLTRNLIINDDLNLLSDTVRAFGEAAAQTEAAIMVAMLTGNPEMRDGTPVFDASRGNIGDTAGLPSKATLAENREAMRLRTGTDGKTIIDAPPRYLLVPADLETEAEEILAAIQPGTTADVNPFAGKLKLLVEPRLPSGTWYLFADPARLACLRYAYLSGAEGVQVQRRESWDTLGLSFRGFLDFGAGWLDWRGAQRVATS